MGVVEGLGSDQGEQLALVPAHARAVRTSRAAERELPVADVDPVARVLVDVGLSHLDRTFDYLVPAKHDADVRAGSRVKVRFAGQDVDGFVLERASSSDHPGRLAFLRRAVSGEPVLTSEVAELCEAVAQRYAGTRSDVLRLAVPPRHASVEKQSSPPPPALTRADLSQHRSDLFEQYAGGSAWLEALSGDGPATRAVWTVLPGASWADGLAAGAAAALLAGRGSVLCVPDTRDLAVLDAALTRALGVGRHVLLTADHGPAARYRAFLAAARGAVQVVAGTRAAAFAPVRDLGLVAMWDDGDDLYAEPRAPYPHTREVLLTRSQLTGCALLLAATSRSVEAASLVATGYARELVAERETVRRHAPRVSITGATDDEISRDPGAHTRLPQSAHTLIREALRAGPVLVQTPRAGYAARLVCERCRTPARCPVCSGPLQITRAHGEVTCRWCAAEFGDRACPECGDTALRAPVVGTLRTAEELGKAFPQVPVRRSGGDHVLAEVPDRPALIVATPGAEPGAAGGYAGVVLMDTWLMMARIDLRTEEESVRRWFNAAALARPSHRGGRVVAVGDPAAVSLQALVRWDPAGYAARELAQRSATHLPPVSRLAVVTGTEDDVQAFEAEVTLPRSAESFGPVATTPGQSRWVIRVPRRDGATLSAMLARVSSLRSARKQPAVRVQVDPYAVG